MATIINPITTVLLNRTELESGEFDRFPFKYILESDGTIAYYTTLTAGRYVLSHEAQIKGLGVSKDSKAPVAEIQPLAYGHKIPGEMFKQVQQFFIDVMAMGPSTYEAQIFIVWNLESKDYRIVVPKQTVSAAAVKYDIGDMLGVEDVIICDIHSHNDMDAFFSGTDDRDDRKNPWISGVFGKLSTNMTNKFRFNDGCGRHFPMDKEGVFDFGENIKTPSEWLAQVSLQGYKNTTSTRAVSSWGEAFALSEDSGEGSEMWGSEDRGDLGTYDFIWDDLSSPEDDLYDSIVDELTDADNEECKVVIDALIARQEDPRHVPELTERESNMYISIDCSIMQVKDVNLVRKVLGQLAEAY